MNGPQQSTFFNRLLSVTFEIWARYHYTMSVCRLDDIRLEWQRLGYKVESTRFNWKKLKYIDTTVNVLKDGKHNL